MMTTDGQDDATRSTVTAGITGIANDKRCSILGWRQMYGHCVPLCVSINVAKGRSVSIRWDSTVHSDRVAPIGGISWGLQLQPHFEDNLRAGWQSHREGMAHDGKWRGVQQG
jgi:hypothetical protein